ncbi:LuxR C-terminal-related transcriptional regulator [Nocardia bovistercoris]|uniref:GAF domain-containing protein n=1 Tax=Nocardia bovistercoris TaxID=2785916 RepID=A0A931II56_9NOCA|nr:LuxR C-terminal-related transcriptional regulator [Nocardia bovistercoris]MBH0781874.1 GAF domain-containing protein [Nocardia bovistercoris]
MPAYDQPMSRPIGEARSAAARRRTQTLLHHFNDQVRQSTSSPSPHVALDVLTVAAESLVRAVPADIWCAVLLDPTTLLDTGGQHEHGFPQHVMPRLFEIEHAQQIGATNLRNLARGKNQASLLSSVIASGDSEDVYYNDILRPLGQADEMRVLVRDRGRCWGLLVMTRQSPFTPEELHLAEKLSTPAAQELRRALLVGGIDNNDVPDAPGWMVIDADGQLTRCSPTARHWLALIQEHGALTANHGPLTVQAIAAHARTTTTSGAPIRARVRSQGGHWLTVHASPPHHADDGASETHVSIGLSQPGELIGIVLDAYGLTPREREITQLILRGRSTKEIRDTLQITAATIQDHLKNIFERTGVNSRRNLVEEVFIRHYLPYLADEPVLTTDGRMRPR